VITKYKYLEGNGRDLLLKVGTWNKLRKALFTFAGTTVRFEPISPERLILPLLLDLIDARQYVTRYIKYNICIYLYDIITSEIQPFSISSQYLQNKN
jgi:hypothetical protein